jgi:23S rRNA pseudouridine1911/1915/1917 synthase
MVALRPVLDRGFMSETREFTVRGEETGSRLDVYLARHMPDWTRSQILRLIRSGLVAVDGHPARKGGMEVLAGQRIAVTAEREEMRARAEALPLVIVYEDDDLVVVNKPAGMVVHVGAGVKSGTLVNALLHHIGRLSSAGGELRPGIVHRLDRMTSGLVIVAKNDAAHRALAAQFKAREIHKTYTVLAHGHVAQDRGEIRNPIGRDPVRRTRMKAGGLHPRDAVTFYRVVRRFQRFTLLEAEPRTGRTHQIRVHFSSLGHPIVGDILYGAPSKLCLEGREVPTLSRTFLHATSLEFRHPRTAEIVRVEADLPSDLKIFLEEMRRAG